MKPSILNKNHIEEIGQEIELDEAKKMITSHDETTLSFTIGKNIIEKILCQNECVGLKLFNAINENGINTLVLIGIDSEGNALINHSYINSNGEFLIQKGIVADRIKTGNIDEQSDWWLFE